MFVAFFDEVDDGTEISAAVGDWVIWNADSITSELRSDLRSELINRRCNFQEA